MTQLNVQEKSKPLLQVNNLKLHFDVDGGLIKAVNGVDFTIEKGMTLGLVGESGCGKSITSKSILRLHPTHCQSSGEILFLSDEDKESIDLLAIKENGLKMRTIRGNKIAIIFQEPMEAFSPMYTVGNQIREMVLLHRTKNKKQAKDIALHMLNKVGIPDPEEKYHQYPHEFSGGMMQRAMIAMALSCDPDLLIADEPTTALDVTIQAQVLALMKSLQEEWGMSILFITHDLGTVAEMCDEVAVMYLGKVVEKATVEEIFKYPKHPYTKGLIRSIPKIGISQKQRLDSIEGTVPLPYELPPMCEFYDRCEQRIEGLCNVREVPETYLTENHKVRCFLYGDEEVQDV